MDILKVAQKAYASCRKRQDEFFLGICIDARRKSASANEQLRTRVPEFSKAGKSLLSVCEQNQSFLHDHVEGASRGSFLFSGKDDPNNYEMQLSALNFAKEARSRIDSENTMAELYRRELTFSDFFMSDVIIAPNACGIDDAKVAAMQKISPSADVEHCIHLLKNGGVLLKGTPYNDAVMMLEILRNENIVAKLQIQNVRSIEEKHYENMGNSFRTDLEEVRENINDTFKKKKAVGMFVGIVFALLIAAILAVISYQVARIYWDVQSFAGGYILVAFVITQLLFVFPLSLIRSLRNKKKAKILTTLYETELVALEKRNKSESENLHASIGKEYAVEFGRIQKAIVAEGHDILSSIEKVHRENVNTCMEATSFLPPDVRGELLDCVIEQMRKGVATNFKDAIRQASLVVEERQERRLARERAERIEREEREHRRAILESQRRAEKYARDQAESQRRVEEYARDQAESARRQAESAQEQARELQRQTDLAKKAAEAQDEQLRYAQRQTQIAEEKRARDEADRMAGRR